MIHISEWFVPRDECAEVCTCNQSVCRCGYVVLPDGRCMTCYRLKGDPVGVIPASLYDTDGDV